LCWLSQPKSYPSNRNLIHDSPRTRSRSSSSLSLSGLELSGAKVCESYIRALLGTPWHFCEEVVLNFRIVRLTLVWAGTTAQGRDLDRQHPAALGHPLCQGLTLWGISPDGKRVGSLFGREARRQPRSEAYRGTSLTRKINPRGPYRRPMPRVLGGSWGVGRFLMGGTRRLLMDEVPFTCRETLRRTRLPRRAGQRARCVRDRERELSLRERERARVSRERARERE